MADFDINGQAAGPFVIDTGSSVVVLSETCARELGLALVADHRPGYGDPSEFPHWWTRLHTLSVGSHVATGAECVVYDTTPFSTAVGEEVAGVMGSAFLGSFELTLDYGSLRWDLGDRS